MPADVELKHIPLMTDPPTAITTTEAAPGQGAVCPYRRSIKGPFDIVGDVHGCAAELTDLLHQLGYRVTYGKTGGKTAGKTGGTFGEIECVTPPLGRTLVFVGDFVDRGPDSMTVLRLAMAACKGGHALAVIGNHDDKFWRWLKGRKVAVTHGLGATLQQLEGEPDRFREDLKAFFATLPSHLILDDGRLVVAHAGIKEAMIGEVSDRVRRFCLYGDTSGERNENGLPVRYHWAAEYRGGATVVYGHTPVADARWVNKTLCIDTGCCFGGKLTALRWPERELVSVAARQVYARRLRAFGHPPVRPDLAP